MGHRISCEVWWRASALSAEEHPQDQAEQRSKEHQQQAAERQRYRALLFWLWPGYAKGSNEALYQENQQFHSCTGALVSPGSCGRLTFVVSDREALPDPAREVLDKAPLDAEDLQREIGDSEPWDEASQDTENNPPEAP